MILHLNAKKLTSSLLEKEAKRLGARYYLSNGHYVFVLQAAYQEVPTSLQPYVEHAHTTSTDRQLSSKEYQSALRSFEIHGLPVDQKHTWVMAGPCAVESQEQIRQVAKFVQGLGLRTLRAGAYKPRTSPYSFQGLGLEGLRILRNICDQYQLALITEVRDATQVDHIIELSDIVQIGAKAMYDQGILRAAAKCRKPVLLKRAFSATLQELLQASEFLLCEGHTSVALCERGIRTFEPKTRFTLDLCGVAYLKQHSNLPIFVDPSHAMGHAYGVADLTRAALAMGVEGLLIEVHPTPLRAQSDASQQLDFETFSALHATLPSIASAVGRTLI